LVTALSDREYDAIPGFVGGNEPSGGKRGRMFELGSYYMVLTTPNKLWLTTDNSEVGLTPYSSNWIKAIEADVGTPTATRSLYRTAMDPVGQRVEVYQRPFTRALVLVRPMAQYSATRYDDASAVSVPLPAGETWHLLHADGTVSAPVTSVMLRNGEAAILIKHSAL
ncbi:MAG: hypothetical protein M3081_08890, partial [Gemmatimonadota bacterium]|nr:hypothetical protein [Gemmatimonadota bacterium]